MPYINFAQTSPRYARPLLKIGDGCQKNKDYDNMLKCYSHISNKKEDDDFNEYIHDVAKIKMAKYYETLGRDFEKAKESYDLVINKNKAQKYIHNFRKKYNMYIKICKDKISEEMDCCICCVEKNSFVKLKCCLNIVCVNCVMGIINTIFMCPFCRKRSFRDYDDIDYSDDDIIVSDDDEGRNFINGIYYRDEIESESDQGENEEEDETESESEE